MAQDFWKSSSIGTGTPREQLYSAVVPQRIGSQNESSPEIANSLPQRLLPQTSLYPSGEYWFQTDT
jgi:hypothetical protein